MKQSARPIGEGTDPNLSKGGQGSSLQFPALICSIGRIAIHTIPEGIDGLGHLPLPGITCSISPSP